MRLYDIYEMRFVLMHEIHLTGDSASLQYLSPHMFYLAICNCTMMDCMSLLNHRNQILYFSRYTSQSNRAVYNLACVPAEL